MGATEEVARFVTGLRYEQLPGEVVCLAKRHLLDGLGVMLAGTVEEGTRLLQAHVVELGGPSEATVLGSRLRLPVPHAALLNGTSGHAMDYDDTQLSTSKASVYGLLTHPTVPVLAAALALGEKRRCSGQSLLLAYVAGVEVACRIADAIHPRHYQVGFHSTATIGGLGACAGAAVLLGLESDRLRTALGIAASLSAGLRENFGTMTKPLHAGRGAQNGLVAADLAARGFTASREILEAPRGFFNAMAGGFDPAKLSGRLGRPFFLVEPGVSIKPYPSGSLSHPAQDVILDLVRTHDVRPEDVERIEVGTNSNVPNALIHNAPTTALEGKFSIPFCMAIAVLERRAGIAQFTDAKVRDPRTVALMQRVRLYVHPELERLGYEHVRAVVEVALRDGRELRGQADVARGHPLKPMTESELEEKFRECAALALPEHRAGRVVEELRRLETRPDLSPLLGALRPL